MKKILIFIFASISTFINADTTVTALNNVHHYFGSGTNNRTVYETVRLPSENHNFAQIFMHFSLSCPNGGCDPWDRKASISVNHLNEWFEIGRYVTPYGIECGWTLDVSDYRSILKGEINLRSFIDTWVQPGWLVTIEFEFISGLPEHPNIIIRNMWNNSYLVYGDPTNPINIDQITEYIPQDAEETFLRITTTGHGQGNTDNAAEFSQKIHEIRLNDFFIYEHDFWRNNCQSNPCSPQNGTWQYNRAGFCPGDKVVPQDFNLSNFVAPGFTTSLSYVLENYFNECSPNNPTCVNGVTCSSCDYNNTGHTEPYYFIGSHLIIYTENNHSNADAFLSISEDTLSGSISINLENYVPVYGIQFDIDLSNLYGTGLNQIQLENGFSGRAEESGWTVSVSPSGRVVAISQDSAEPIPAGEGLLTNIPWNRHYYPDVQGKLSIENIFVSGYFGAELSYESGASYELETILTADKLNQFPDQHKLLPCYPNPFNPYTKIPFFIAQNENVNLEIFNLNGKKEETLLVNAMMKPGNHEIIWNASDHSSGTYFVKLSIGQMVYTEKLMLLK